MSGSSTARRMYFLASPHKPEAAAVLNDLVGFAGSRCQVVGSGVGLEGSAAVKAGAERVVVLGGDGTLIGTARSMGARQIPLIGVNVGKLGFLAEFSVSELRDHFEAAVSDDSLISYRTLLHVAVDRNGQRRDENIAVNDCVIQAGAPFRIIRLGLSINEEHLTEVRGDGLIVCTPSGSTAHNLSAGGPIMEPGVDAIVVTPMCPHSLTHKPLVVERGSLIEIYAVAVNEGTTAIIDGQVSCPLGPGDKVLVRRLSADFQLVHNPQYSPWHNLITKLHWGQPPLA